MEIRQLKTFKAVVDHMSFYKAAESIHYAQSTVSVQIQALEDDLSIQLFERLGRQIVLTEVGERLYLYACKMLELADAARADVMEGERMAGSLTIRVPESLCVHRLPSVLAIFRNKMPNINLNFITCAQEGLKQDLAKGITDLAFLLTESIHSKDLLVEVLGAEHLVFVAAPDHPFSKIDRFETDMVAEDTILLSRADCSYRRILEGMLKDLKIEAKMVLEFSSIASILSCIEAGLGITLIPRIAVEKAVELGRLVILPWTEGDIEVCQLMIWHKDKWLTPYMKTFMDITREVLKIG